MDDIAGCPDDVAKHGRSRRIATRSIAVEHQGTCGLGLDEDGIIGLAHGGQRVLLGHQRGVHAGIDRLGAVLTLKALANGQQLDGIAGIIGRGDIRGGDLGNALAVDVLKLHASVEAQRRHDGGLGGGVMALYIRGGIGLGIAQAGSLRQRFIIGSARGLHRVQDEVGGAVDDAGDALYLIASQGAPQHAHYRNRGGYGSLEVEIYTGAVGGLRQLVCVRGNQGLIGGHHGLSGVECGEHQLAREVDTADNLNHEVDIIAGDERLGVIGQQLLGHARAQLIFVVDGNAANLGWATDAVSKGMSILSQQAKDLSTNGAKAQQRDTNGLALALAGMLVCLKLASRCSHNPSPLCGWGKGLVPAKSGYRTLYRTSCLLSP